MSMSSSPALGLGLLLLLSQLAWSGDFLVPDQRLESSDGRFNDMTSDGTRLLLAEDSVFSVIDFQNSSIVQFTHIKAEQLAVASGLLFAYSADAGMNVYDLQDPDLPFLYSMDMVPFAMSGGQKLWVLDSFLTLFAYQPDRQAAERLLELPVVNYIGTANENTIMTVSSDETRVWLTGLSEALFSRDRPEPVFGFSHDLGDPSSPRWSHMWLPEATVSGYVGSQQSLVPLFDRGLGLVTHGQVSSDSPRPAGALQRVLAGHDEIRQVAVQGNRAYLVVGESGLTILDVSDITSPVLLERMDFGSASIQKLVAEEDWVAVQQGNVVRVYKPAADAARRQVIPWVVANQQYNTRLVFSNEGREQQRVALRAVPLEGEAVETEVVLAAGGLQSLDAGELFAGLTRYSLFISSAGPVEATFLTVLGGDGSVAGAPSQAGAISLESLGRRLIFPHPTSDQNHALTLVAPGNNRSITVELALLNGIGQVVGRAEVTLDGERPLAGLVGDWFGEIPADHSIRAFAPNDSVLIGTLFTFDAAGGPAMVHGIGY